MAQDQILRQDILSGFFLKLVINAVNKHIYWTSSVSIHLFSFLCSFLFATSNFLPFYLQPLIFYHVVAFFTLPSYFWIAP